MKPDKQERATAHHLSLARRNLAIALKKINLLTATIAEQAARIAELERDLSSMQQK